MCVNYIALILLSPESTALCPHPSALCPHPPALCPAAPYFATTLSLPSFHITFPSFYCTFSLIFLHFSLIPLHFRRPFTAFYPHANTLFPSFACTLPLFFRTLRSRGLTFSWWGCYGLCPRHKPTELAHSFLFFLLVSVSVFMALSTVFHSIHSPDNSPLSHLVLFLPY